MGHEADHGAEHSVGLSVAKEPDPQAVNRHPFVGWYEKESGLTDDALLDAQLKTTAAGVMVPVATLAAFYAIISK